MLFKKAPVYLFVAVLSSCGYEPSPESPQHFARHPNLESSEEKGSQTSARHPESELASGEGSQTTDEGEPITAFVPLQSIQEKLNLRQSKTSQKPQAVLAVFGGWNTCKDGPGGTDIFVRAAEMIKRQAKKGVFYKVVAACYGKISSTPAVYLSDSHASLVKAGPENIFRTLINQASLVEGQNIYLVGHSYGGWLAMNAVTNMPKHIHIQGLATLDPISKANCTPTALANSYIRSTTGVKPHRGCTQAPTDISVDLGLAINKRSSWWKNFYQITSVYLHSGPIVGAENTLLNYTVSGIFDIFGPHADLDSEERAWSQIEGEIVN